MPVRLVSSVLILIGAPLVRGASSVDLASGSCGAQPCSTQPEPEIEDGGVQLLQGRLQLLQGRTAFQGAQGHSSPAVPNCTELPYMCREPLNCQRPVTPAEVEGWRTKTEGHGTPRDFCQFPGSWYGEVPHCLLDFDLEGCKRAVHSQLNAAGEDTYAKACFMENRCQDTEVTEDTTPEEVEQLCDQRFPGWRAFMAGRHDYGFTGWNFCFDGGHGSTRFYKSMLLVCKNDHCQNDQWRQRYGHLLP